jgi:Methylase involved in ubiquinone/menaquinone biosynthesis
MKKCILLVVSFFVSTHLFALKECEEWWENCLGSFVSLSNFQEQLGSVHAPSRVAVRSHVKSMNYHSILDAACGLALDYWGFKKERTPILYQGIDITEKLVLLAKEQGVPVTRASIENLPFTDNQFDVCYARAILERLEHYPLALRELVRVASKEVVVVFAIKPEMTSQDALRSSYVNGYLLYSNHYSRPKLEQFLTSLPKVFHFQWEEVDDRENILHIYLRK